MCGLNRINVSSPPPLSLSLSLSISRLNGKNDIWPTFFSRLDKEGSGG